MTPYASYIITKARTIQGFPVTVHIVGGGQVAGTLTGFGGEGFDLPPAVLSGPSASALEVTGADGSLTYVDPVEVAAISYTPPTPTEGEGE